jgi:hypothetical protein
MISLTGRRQSLKEPTGPPSEIGGRLWDSTQDRLGARRVCVDPNERLLGMNPLAGSRRSLPPHLASGI